MACSHEGEVRLARKIIDSAAAARADAVQFQIWIANEIMVPHHKNFSLVKSVELTHDDWSGLIEYSRERYPSLEIVACVYERESVKFCLSEGIEAFKIHSEDLSNPSLIEYIAETGKRIHLSIGSTTLDEIATAIDWIKCKSNNNIWLMFGLLNKLCLSRYSQVPFPYRSVLITRLLQTNCFRN